MAKISKLIAFSFKNTDFLLLYLYFLYNFFQLLKSVLFRNIYLGWKVILINFALVKAVDVRCKFN